MKNISSAQTAKLLGVSVGDLSTLEKQGIIHSPYSLEEVSRIKSRQYPTLSEEAAQVGIQIQQEVVTTLTGLQKFKKRISVLSLFTVAVFVLFTIIIAILFNIFPGQTSDFFGYYYRFNASDDSQTLVNGSESPNVLSASTENLNVLQAATGPVEAPVTTSVLADIIKPVAGASLILVKAINDQKYEQIVTNPVLATGGLSGPQGPAGPRGSDGSDGASVGDVMTTAGDTLIRDSDNTTVRLSIGSNDQVLTIANGMPAWTDLTNANLSGNAGVTNANLANSALTIAAGNGLSGGGSVSLGESTTLGINLTSSRTAGSISSNSGLELSGSGLSLLQGCGDGQLLKWTDAGGWACAGADVGHAASYNTDEAMTNISFVQTTLTTVSVTPSTSTADVYVTGQAEVFSGSDEDQFLTLVIETTNNCTGTTVGNATVTYTITSKGDKDKLGGVLVVSGVDLNPGTSSRSYSLCASTPTGDTDVQNWRLEALVIN